MHTFAKYFLLEKKKPKLKRYPIQRPPKSKTECIKICSKTKMADGPWYMNSGDGGDDKRVRKGFKAAAAAAAARRLTPSQLCASIVACRVSAALRSKSTS